MEEKANLVKKVRNQRGPLVQGVGTSNIFVRALPG